MLKIDLHGQLESEARVNFKSFLKECTTKKIKYARVSHGHGKYVLRNMVVQELGNNKFVKKFGFAHPNDGGTGITIN